MDKNRRKTGGRQKGTPNKSTPKREETEEFFRTQVIDDETEAGFWRWFITGYIIDPETKNVLPMPVNPAQVNAFKRAVEYKRGMPVQPLVHWGDDSRPITIVNKIERPKQ